MTTIDNLDINVHYQYAERSRLVEEVKAEWRVAEANVIPQQTEVINWRPTPSELDLLLGGANYYAAWGYFLPPKLFRERRRSPFSPSRIVPTLGSLEEQEDKEELVQNTKPNSPEEEKQKEAILSCFQMIRTINEWLGLIMGKKGEFLQG